MANTLGSHKLEDLPAMAEVRTNDRRKPSALSLRVTEIRELISSPYWSKMDPKSKERWLNQLHMYESEALRASANRHHYHLRRSSDV